MDWIKRLLSRKDLELRIATYKGDVRRVKELLEKGADPNAQDEDGSTPLHAAAFGGHVDVVRLLLEQGANPNAKDKHGFTPLHDAAYGGHVGIVKLLLEHGADPTVKDGDGETPLDLARKKGYRGVASLIEEWLGQRRPPQQRRQRREAAEALPPGGSQKAVPLPAPAPTAQPTPAQSPPPRGASTAPSLWPLADVELVERLSGEAISYAPVSPSGPSFDVRELGLSGCVRFACGAYFCVYRCVWQGAEVAVKVPAHYRADFEGGAPPHRGASRSPQGAGGGQGAEPQERPPPRRRLAEIRRPRLRVGRRGVPEGPEVVSQRCVEGPRPRGLGPPLPPQPRGGSRRPQAGERDRGGGCL
ncbi:hypothetical protein B7L68_07655 [Thermoproteus sp. CP80]|nr:hypothetical protein B7L68_07655 [Thermoproteus sp. CP80]